MSLTRRDVLCAGVGLLAGSTLVGGCSAEAGTAAAGGGADPRPDLLVLITDQERAHTHWPEGLLERLMPSWARLQQHGLTVRRAYCAASQCSPSRAVMLTGEYSNVNGIPTLGDTGMPALPDLPNVASVLEAAGYEVAWKGKWHLSFPVGFRGGPPSGEVWTSADIREMDASYGFDGWNPPDAGNNAGVFGTAGVPSMGGGRFDNDGRYVAGVTDPAEQTAGVPGGESVLDFLGRVARTPRGSRRPFALFVSLVNPHDITFFPTGWDQGGYALEDFAGLGVDLPGNFGDSLAGKPSVQQAYRDAVQAKDPLGDDPAQGATSSQYVNFYAYLHSVVEPHLQRVLDALDSLGLTDGTVVVRTADHGEGGLSHGLREKSYSAYEEMIHVPLVISNPRLFPAPVETEALWSHADLLATLADLAGATPVGVGRSFLPVLRDPAARTQEAVLFCFDDVFVLPPTQPGSHLRALRDGRYTYAVYFGAAGAPFEYELYDNATDPLQLTNLVADPGAADLWRSLHTRLVTRMAEANATPPGFAFPPEPT